MSSCCMLLPGGREEVSEPPDYLRYQHLWLKLLVAKLQVVCVCARFSILPVACNHC